MYTGKVRLLKSGDSAARISLDELSKFADYLKVLIYKMLLLFMFVENHVLHSQLLANDWQTDVFGVLYIIIPTMITITFGCRRRIVLVTTIIVSTSRSGQDFLLEACFLG